MMQLILAFTLLPVAIRVAALTRDLHIVNKEIAPDGFTRSFVLFAISCHVSNALIRTVLAEGTFPGPLLGVQKVCVLLQVEQA